jgi:hydrogenase maturation protease
MSWLLIGIGNTLRRDDGVGPWIATQIRAAAIPDVHTRTTHQLTPELTMELAEHDLVLFIDACESEVESPIVEVFASSEPNRLGHAFSPANLLALCENVGIPCPRAWMAAVTGSDFGFGEGLSFSALQRAEAMVAFLQNWLREPLACTKSA